MCALLSYVGNGSVEGFVWFSHIFSNFFLRVIIIIIIIIILLLLLLLLLELFIVSLAVSQRNQEKEKTCQYI